MSLPLENSSLSLGSIHPQRPIEIHTHTVEAGLALRLTGQLEFPFNPLGKESSKQRRSRAEVHQGPEFPWQGAIRMMAEKDGW